MCKTKERMLSILMALLLMFSCFAGVMAPVAQAAPEDNSLQVKMRFDKSPTAPGDTVTATVYLENYESAAEDIYAMSVEVPAKTENLTYVKDSFNSYVKKNDLNITDTFIMFGYTEDKWDGVPVLPRDTKDLFSFQLKVNDQLKTDTEEELYMDILVGGNEEVMLSGKENVKLPIQAVIPVKSVSLDQTETALKIGESTALKATVLPENASDKTVGWSTSDKTIATVDGNGLVQAVGEGQAIITATTKDGSKTANCTINVKKPIVAVTGVTLDKNEAALKIGETATLAATVAPADATNKNVSWSSSDEAIATVKDGVVTAVAAGKATITVTTEDGQKTAECVVTVSEPEPVVVPVTNVTLDKNEAALKIGETATLAATVAPADATNKNVSWSSSDEAIATVKDGVVTAVAAGKATITVTTEDGQKTANCMVTVSEPEPVVVPVTGVTLDKNEAALKIGETATLAATIAPADATNKNVSWASSDEAIASVKGGVVTAVAAGEATVTVTTEDGNKTAECVVTVSEPEPVVVPVTGVTLDKTEAALKIGETATLAATIAPANATNKNVSWSSSDEAIATVKDGVVTAAAAGEATITVITEDGNKTAECVVTVSEAEPVVVPVIGVTLDKAEASLKIGETATLAATIAPANATNKNVSWSSSDEAIATVKDGVVTAVAAGEATVTVTTEDGSKTASCVVTVSEPEPEVVPVTGVTLDKTEAALKVGETATLAATIAPANATNKNVSWSSSDEAIATVKDGVVTAVAAGKATITVITEDGQKTAECVVTVTKKDDPKPTTPTTPTVKPGDNGQAGSNNGTTTETTAKTAANNGTNPNTSLTTQEKVGTMLVWCTVTALCVLAVFSIKRRQTK